MTDETFFELHLANFGRQPYNPLRDILTGTGLVPENNAQLGNIQALLQRAGIAATHVYTHAGPSPSNEII